MKILITGGTGFIGSYMANHLSEKGHRVTICDNNSRGVLDNFVSHLNFIECDLTDKSQLSKLDTDFDCVYHFAAINGTINFYEIPHLVLKVNTLININILDWCVENNIKILSTSSSEVYAATKDKTVPTNEDVRISIDDVYNPRYSYAGSKIFGELLFLNYHKHYNLDVKIVRPHNFYGARMGFEHVIPQVLKRVYNKQDPFEIYGHNQTRAFCYISDAINAMELVMESEKCTGKIIHIGNSEETKVADLVQLIFQLCDYNPSVEIVDPPVGSVSRRCPDISLLTKYTGFIPKFDLEYGLRKSCEWYLNYYGSNS